MTFSFLFVYTGLFSISLVDVPLIEVLLLIDDIEIDEPVPMASTSSHSTQNIKRGNLHQLDHLHFQIHNITNIFPVYIAGTEREKLLDSEGDDAKPRLRTREEIIAKYRKAEVVIFVGFTTFHSELFVLVDIFNHLYLSGCIISGWTSKRQASRTPRKT